MSRRIGGGPAIAAIAAALLLAGCLSRQKAVTGGVMESEQAYGLYALPPIALAVLPDGTDPTDFWDAFGAKAAGTEGQAVAIHATLLSSRVLRIERRESGVPLAVHFAIYEQHGATGTAIRLQPLIGWRRQFGGGAGSEPLTAVGAGPVVTALRGELPALAAGLP